MATAHQRGTTTAHKIARQRSTARRTPSGRAPELPDKLYARTYSECIRCFTHNDYTRVVGLSATPGRTVPEERKDLIELFSNNLVRIRGQDGRLVTDAVGYLQEAGYLAKLDCKVLRPAFLWIQQMKREYCRRLRLTPRETKEFSNRSLLLKSEVNPRWFLPAL